jgi:hypothetical protein
VGDDRREVLRAFLKAVPAGLVELRWGIICPSCMTSSQQVRALEDIKPEGHCQLCDITFDLDLDRAVEATFLPAPGGAARAGAMFCIGGPGRTPHVLVQARSSGGDADARRAAEAGATGCSRAEARRPRWRWTTGARGWSTFIDAVAVHPRTCTPRRGASFAFGRLARTRAT